MGTKISWSPRSHHLVTVSHQLNELSKKRPAENLLLLNLLKIHPNENKWVFVQDRRERTRKMMVGVRGFEPPTPRPECTPVDLY